MPHADGRPTQRLKGAWRRPNARHTVQHGCMHTASGCARSVMPHAPSATRQHDHVRGRARHRQSPRCLRCRCLRGVGGSADELAKPTIESSTAVICSLELEVPKIGSAAAGTPRAPPHERCRVADERPSTARGLQEHEDGDLAQANEEFCAAGEHALRTVRHGRSMPASWHQRARARCHLTAACWRAQCRTL